MKAYVQTACLLGFAALSIVSGLGLTDLPDCAKPCAENLPAQCSKVDFKCICGSTDWISGISCCVLKSCSAADQQKTIDVASQLCSLVDIKVQTVATCPSSTIAALASSGSTSAGSTSSSVSAASASSKQSTSSSVTASHNSATTTTGSSASSAASAASDLSSSSATAVSTGMAGHLVGQGIGAAGAAALALALI